MYGRIINSHMSLRVLAAVVFVAAALPAYAQSVRLEFNAGMVSLSVENVPLRTVLAEWARLSGATIVNGDRVTGPPVTLELTNVTERQALDILLRNAAGYVLAPRRAGTAGVSAFDRIMILPTSVGPRNPPPGPATALGGPRPVLVPRPPVIGVPEPNEVAPEDPPAEVPTDAAETPPVRVQPAIGAPRPLIPSPIVRIVNGQPANDAPAEDVPADETTTTPAVRTTPGNPFGIPFGSSPTPGVVTPAPRQTAPTPGPQGR